MPNDLMFVLTDVTSFTRTIDTSDDATLLHAARRALDIAGDARLYDEHCAFDRKHLRVGKADQYGAIQGRYGARALKRNGLATMLPRPEPSAEEIQVLRDNCNLARHLVELAVFNPNKIGQYDRNYLIYPDLFVTGQGDTLPTEPAPNEDIWGQPFPEDLDTIGGEGFRLFLSAEPLRELRWAQFKVDYIRYLQRFPHHIVVALEVHSE